MPHETDNSSAQGGGLEDQAPHSQPKLWYWLAGLAIAVLVGTGGFLLSQTRSGSAVQKAGQSKAGAGRGGRGSGIVPVSVTEAQKGDMGEYVSAFANVVPVYTVTIKSRVDGQLMEVDFKEGQMVQKGDLLAVIDPRPYQAAVEQAEGQLARDQAILKNSLIDLDRYKMIWTQRAIPKQQLDTQEATVSQNQGTVKLDQGQLDSARVQLDYTRITSPIPGRVGLRLVDPGNIVHAADTNGMLVITQLQPITVVFSIAEDYVGDVAGQVRAGHALRVDAFDREQQKQIGSGSLLTLDNQIDSTTGTVKLRALFPNKDLRLFPNEFVNAKLLVRTLHNVTLVPAAAIQRSEQMAYVYALKPDQTVISKKVNVRTTDGVTTAIDGVDPGTAVVTDGFDKLQDGSKVVVRQAAAAGQAGNETTTGTSPQNTNPGETRKRTGGHHGKSAAEGTAQ